MCNDCKHKNGNPPQKVSMSREKSSFRTSKGDSVHKYAQLGKKGSESDNKEEFPEIHQGTNIDKQATLVKRKKRKYLSHHLSLSLINANKAQREIDLEELQETVLNNPNLTDKQKQELFFSTDNLHRDTIRSYWNMYKCNRVMLKDKNGNVKTRYCKNRLCLICNSIRTAALLDKYACIFEAWEDNTYMVTLTIKNCIGDDLKESIDEMQKAFIKAKDSIKKKYQSGLVKKFEGLRKLECTSLREDDYHPHFHILVKGKQNAELLRNYWVKNVNKSHLISCQHKGVNRKGELVDIQDVRKADKGSAKEIFKYFTKIISTASTETGERKIYTNRLDVIFKAMKRKRVFQTFGFKLEDYQLRKFTPAPPPPEEAIKPNEIDIPDFLEICLDHDYTSEQADINKMFNDFYKKERTGERALDLMTDLYVYESNFKLKFEAEVLPTRTIPRFDEEKTKEYFKIHSTLFKSKKTSLDILNFQADFHALEASRDFSLKLEEIEIDLSDQVEENEEQVFLFDGESGNWIDYETGETLINYELGEVYLDLKRAFVIPSKYRNKLLELSIDT